MTDKIEAIRQQLTVTQRTGSLDAEPRSGITTDDVAYLLAEVDFLKKQPDAKTGLCACCGLNAWAMANVIEEGTREVLAERNALREQVERLREVEIVSLEAEVVAHVETIEQLKEERSSARYSSQQHQVEAQRLRAALEQYADAKNWHDNGGTWRGSHAGWVLAQRTL